MANSSEIKFSSEINFSSEKDFKKPGSADDAQAAKQSPSLFETVTEEYNKRIAEGQSEAEVYRELLRDIEKIEEMLRSLPGESETTEKEEVPHESEKRRNKKLSSLHSSIQGLLWLLTVAAYFLISFTFGGWHLTWLMFLTSSIASILLKILFDYNKGVPMKKLTGKLHGIMWLAIVVLYFLIGLTFGGWHLTWLIFILGAACEVVIGMIKKIKN
ncbi:MAG: hypothetical protein E7638_02000 [Ruminococcaceae bacterium]|nr:hypothetical protein [Oscillospiraceae bacterium]